MSDPFSNKSKVGSLSLSNYLPAKKSAEENATLIKSFYHNKKENEFDPLSESER
jgi:hypothetical protein